ncbi:alcohol dehydrogenase [Xylariales sp. AK1849]|nr:alcohol dehydrogenase [Xylariales sp. AK1849]
MSTVRSWTYTTAGYPQTLQLRETSVPSSPAPHHVLIRVKASALNPLDIQLMNLPINSIPGLKWPKVLARDFAGVVLAAAPETPFNKGDEVMGITIALNGSGTLTEVAHVSTRSSVIVKKPAHLSWSDAASLPLVWLTAYTSVEKCAPFMKETKPDDNRIAVLGGSSATGIYTVWLARQRGWTVLASCSGRNANFVRERGADQVVDYTSSADAVKSTVTAFQPSAIVDCVGGTECIGLAPQYVTIVGDKTSRSTAGGSILYAFYPRMVLRWFLGCLGVGKSYECISLQLNEGWLEKATELRKEDVIIDSVYSFDKVKEAYERLNTGRAKGKVVIEIEL